MDVSPSTAARSTSLRTLATGAELNLCQTAAGVLRSCQKGRKVTDPLGRVASGELDSSIGVSRIARQDDRHNEGEADDG